MNALIKNEPYISIDDYLALELTSDIKHEYIDGFIVAMSGASKNHNIITGNVLAAIHLHLRNMPCRPFSADVKVKVANKFFYPDMMVVCEDKTNNVYYTESPLLIIEVLSKSTRRTDETIKRKAYQSLPSLQEYILIEQNFAGIEVCRRSLNWQSQHYFLGDEVYFESIDFSLPVVEIYRWVDNEEMNEFNTAQQ
jgi:Uma2 family endonuclease